MARPRVVSVRTPQSSRRKTTWGGIHSLAYTTIAAGTNVLLAFFSAAGLVNVPRSTLIRVRGVVSVRSDQSIGVEAPMGAFGIALANENARVAGAASLLGPITDSSADEWQTWQGLFPPGLVTTNMSDVREYMIDSKGQRKLSDLESIVVMVENASATIGMEIAVQLRFLFLLS